MLVYIRPPTKVVLFEVEVEVPVCVKEAFGFSSCRLNLILCCPCPEPPQSIFVGLKEVRPSYVCNAGESRIVRNQDVVGSRETQRRLPSRLIVGRCRGCYEM